MTPTPCIEWSGAVSTEGYGKQGGRYVHRLAYEAMVGPIPDGLEIDHVCRNKLCWNPWHLEAVTHQENNQRAFRGWTRPRAYVRATHCSKGHLFDGSRRDRGKETQRCLTCHREQMRKYRRQS